MAWNSAKVVPMPKSGKAKYDLPKACRPIRLQPCLTKVMAKVVASRLSNAASLTGASSREHFGCLPRWSADGALRTLHTPAQHCLRYSVMNQCSHPNRPAILTNDFDGGFNYIDYRRLNQVMEAMKL